MSVVTMTLHMMLCLHTAPKILDPIEALNINVWCIRKIVLQAKWVVFRSNNDT